MASRWIVGGGDTLDLAFHAWRQACPDGIVEKVVVPQGADYEFDYSVFDTLSPEKGDVFIAFDERFGNFKRMELFRAAIERGFKLASFVSANASVAGDVVLGKNVFVGPMAVIGYGSKLEYNTFVHAGAHIGSNCLLRPSVWVEHGVQVGNKVEIGTHAILRTGAIVKSGVKIGKGAELGWPQIYSADVSEKTVYDIRYDEPIYVYGS